MNNFVVGLLKRIWNLISGTMQWRVLWLLNDKFVSGVKVIVVNPQGKILLAKHVFRRSTRWQLPAGWMESGETVFQAAVRETSEEFSITVKPVRITFVESGYRLRLGFHVYCETRSHTGDLECNALEIESARFFATDELPQDLSNEDAQAIGEAIGKNGST